MKTSESAGGDDVLYIAFRRKNSRVPERWYTGVIFVSVGSPAAGNPASVKFDFLPGQLTPSC